MTTSEKYSISFHDFGGQDVFASIFNYFMNPDTLYVIVSSMEELLSPNTVIVEVNFYVLIHKYLSLLQEAYDYIGNLLNTITIHTRRTSSDLVASVIIVGTRKDVIQDLEQFLKINNELKR